MVYEFWEQVTGERVAGRMMEGRGTYRMMGNLWCSIVSSLLARGGLGGQLPSKTEMKRN